MILNCKSIQIKLRTLVAACAVLLVSFCGTSGFPDEADEFTPIFNGRDLSGWHGQEGLWFVKDGILIGRHEGASRNTFLIHEGSYSDFVLKASVRAPDPPINSGIQFRSEELPNYAVRGYQADIGSQYWGLLVDDGGRGILVPFDGIREGIVNEQAWNEYVITCRGDHITLELNGHTTADVIDLAGEREGVFALQLHQSQEPIEVHYKDMLLKPLKAEPNDGFEPLFNGRDLTGWDGDELIWSVKDGMIIAENDSADKGALLTTNQRFSDFQLKALVQFGGGNPGGRILTLHEPTADPLAEGFAVTLGPGNWGSLYSHGQQIPKMADAEGKPGWNEVVITSLGDEFAVAINGQITAHHRNPQKLQEGHIAFEIQGNASSTMRLKDIYLRHLPSSARLVISGQAPGGMAMPPTLQQKMQRLQQAIATSGKQPEELFREIGFSPEDLMQAMRTSDFANAEKMMDEVLRKLESRQ